MLKSEKTAIGVRGNQNTTSLDPLLVKEKNEVKHYNTKEKVILIPVVAIPPLVQPTLSVAESTVKIISIMQDLARSAENNPPLKKKNRHKHRRSCNLNNANHQIFPPKLSSPVDELGGLIIKPDLEESLISKETSCPPVLTSFPPRSSEAVSKVNDEINAITNKLAKKNPNSRLFQLRKTDPS
jgi:hypothetical protein